MKKLLFFVILFIFATSISFADEATEEKLKSMLSGWENFEYDKEYWDNYDFFAHTPYIVWGTLTEEEDEDEYDLNEMMAGIVEFRMSKWEQKEGTLGEIIEDVEITPEIIKENDLVLIGSPESNLVLKVIHDKLPIQIPDDETILAGEEKFVNDEIGTIFRYPNPLNPERMVLVVTAPISDNLRYIPKNEDYVIYSVQGNYSMQADRYWELALGSWDENGKLSEVNYVDNELIDSGENDPIEVGEINFYPPPKWAQNGVMYEIFVRSFYDSDGDGIGDLKGITQKLDYLNDGDDTTTDDLDIEVIWLMPIFDSPSYHCYDIRDYMKINPDYGTNEDFQELLREAHKRGIRIVTDLILNHSSYQHEFFQDALNNPDSKYDEWFFFVNESNTRAHNWEFRTNPKDKNMLDPSMPAWNVNNPEVREYLFSMAKYWMDPNGDGDFSDGIDGFRCDYALGPPHEFWKLFRQEVKALNPDVLLLGEIWADPGTIHSYFDNQFDMAFDFPYQGSLTGTLTSATARELTRAMGTYNTLPEGFMMNRFLNNHDMNRIYSRMSQERAKLGAALLLACPQMPMIYYGDEIGMQGEKDPYDEGIRRPMEWCKANECKGMTDWYPVWNEDPDGISVEEQVKAEDSVLDYFRKLLRIREENPVIETGEVEIVEIMVDSTDYRRAIAYTISNDEETVLVVANLHDEMDLTLDLSHISEEAVLKEVLAEDSMEFAKLTEENKENYSMHCGKEQAYIFILE